MRQDVTSAAHPVWSAERSALAADALRQSGRLRLRVHGESMLPTLWPGDVVEIARCSMGDVRSNEIVLAAREGRLFLHRFVAHCAPSGFQLRGDSKPGCDPQYPPEALLGRLVSRPDQRRGSASATPLPASLSRALGVLLCYCGVARRLALKLQSRRRK
jgi:hypothetical protein